MATASMHREHRLYKPPRQAYGGLANRVEVLNAPPTPGGTMTTVTEGTVSTDEWVRRARSIAPVVAEHRIESEQQRHMAEPIFDAIREIGIIGMCAPRAFGGPQANPLANLQVIEEISRQDGSAGWNAMIWTGTGLFAEYLPEDAAREIIGDGTNTIVGGAVNPTGGKARPVAGGFNVSGRWSFGSGYHYLTWLIVGCMVMDGDQPRMLPNGAPDIVAAFVRKSDSEMVDTWYTAGLRGTGSHDFVVDDVFVPLEHTLPLFSVFASGAPRPSRAYRTPFYDAAGAQIASVGLGIARDAIDTFKGMVMTKTPAIGTTILANL